jgi:hypothetical protein
MIPDTIYSDKKNIVLSLGAYDDEARVIDRLLSMGYVKCSGVDLKRRLSFLIKEIERLDLRKGKSRKQN